MTDLSSALQLAAPELTLAVGGLVLLMLGAFTGEKSTRLISGLSILLLAAASVLAAVGPLGTAFNGAYVADPLAVYGKVAIFLSAAVAIVLGDGWIHRNGIAKFEYPVLIVLASVGMSMMASSGDLISLYIGIEMHSLALYVLAAYHRDNLKASEAGLKYFVLGALSSGLLLYGASLIYGFAGSMRFVDIAAFATANPGPGLIFGLVFLICGLAFKVSAAPFHMWTPDVYEGAPTPVVALFATAPKIAAMVLIIRVLVEGFGVAHGQWAQVIILISLISFAVGSFGGLMQKDIQRLLAYSSIINIGYALLGVAAGTEAGVQATLMFMTLYVMDQFGFFAVLLSLSRNGRPIRKIADLAGLKKDRPLTAVALTILSLSAVGIPPMSGFWGKFFVFGAAADAGYWMAGAAGLVASVVAGFYYLRIIKVMWFDTPEFDVTTDKSPLEAKWVALAAAAFCFPLVIVALTWLEPLTRAAASGVGVG
ncbi:MULTISPECIES: NADH-quinone oxidoreductase subunit NuoN [unclassified Brevundimonas]|uniref:NADH-quinone oxidoreductase subunit NuoN n=1 Tax=unclassified Brevundimonas TaxID=2622653 RepID=UPI000CFD73EC|nr:MULTISPECIES: NADH-quinone oxidoreductase subunit NuoN [unclassified Brevundimonas]PRA31991.1 NADH-quinone oxidoreductase subunit NuoN [Brevundimonas sp. MYb27]PQZ82731.1 NADH-quinone oxidoreductase subunit NuoN [Brevundimonas sp. MYb31]PRB16983.1 NADH-quinone oxidoreductase subunit NuoN [Brevundimonas sp. MYb52]PRB37302.1 NADH-quinone oxidoreductase subunit NuoN [Brevundimonas sp. MYb46]PRB54806.1 NADH-quinone oxidoreductase subunit NuoN [Brevundimonas sp. MYb33]